VQQQHRPLEVAGLDRRPRIERAVERAAMILPSATVGGAST
jgi:hypothetical protein